jgi:hypothetical protein
MTGSLVDDQRAVCLLDLASRLCPTFLSRGRLTYNRWTGTEGVKIGPVGDRPAGTKEIRNC